MRRSTYIFVAAMAIALGALPASATAFPWFSDPYTGTDNDCNAISDPVNTDGGTQSLGVGSAKSCNVMQYQVASGSLSRFHVRLWRIPGTSGASKLAAGAVHHEDFVLECPGHAVDSNGGTGSGFDWGRRELVDQFQAGGHDAVGKLWGNTANFEQCDGDFARSNGVGVVVSNNHRH